MAILSGYMFDMESDGDVNKIIKWWNDALFEQGYVQMDEFEIQCNIAPEFNHMGYCWTFELTTDFVEFYNRKDSYHVKSGWKIKLPEPKRKSSLKELNYD